MPVRSFKAASLEELVRVTLEIRAEMKLESFLWFRGVNCNTYPLLPKIMREGKTSEQVFERERRLITRFRQRSMAYWPAGYPQNDWEHLFAMQHHGLPTRLLDWSENLFVAAHFALSSEAKHPSTALHEGACTPIIWCIDPVQWNKTMPGLSEFREEVQVLTTVDDHLDPYRPETSKKRPRSPVAMFGTHNSERIVAQRGTFVVWGSEVKSLDEFAHEKVLWKIELTAPRLGLFRDLQTLGFSETMVFPELTALAVELDRVEGWR